MTDLSDRVKKLRTDKGLKQGTAASGIGISQRMLCAIESGDNQPTVETLAKIALFYGVSSDYLLFGVVDQPTPMERDILREIREDKAVYNALIGRVTAKKTVNSLLAVA